MIAKAIWKVSWKMRTQHVLILFLASFLAFCRSAAGGGIPVDTVHNATELEALVALQRDSINIFLKPGDYHLHPKQDVDTLIEGAYGRPVPITYGLKITSRVAIIRGAKAYSSAIYTHAGYGLYFLNCQKASVEGLIITAGARDTERMATDAGIVAVNSRIDIVDNIIFENIGDTVAVHSTQEGIMGICIREGSYAFIYNNQIARNSWSGIGIYRGAQGTITGNLIDGVDNFKENKVGGGRGTGIIITRNGRATVETNVIKRYWSGVGVFVNADALISENLIEDIRTWGIAVWDADTGKPIAKIERNVVFKTGACGAAIARYREGPEPGFFMNNIIVESAQDREYDAPGKLCYQCALSVQGRPQKFLVEDNVFYKNFWLAPCNNNLDIPVSDFIQVLRTRYSTLPLRWYAGYSEFIQRFYIYLGNENKNQ